MLTEYVASRRAENNKVRGKGLGEKGVMTAREGKAIIKCDDDGGWLDATCLLSSSTMSESLSATSV